MDNAVTTENQEKEGEDLYTVVLLSLAHSLRNSCEQGLAGAGLQGRATSNQRRHYPVEALSLPRLSAKVVSTNSE